MLQTNPIPRMLCIFRRWWRAAIGKQRRPSHQKPADDVATTQPLPLNGRAFEEFLHQLGVKMEGGTAQALQSIREASKITLLQQSRHHDAFYRVDLAGGHPYLLILI